MEESVIVCTPSQLWTGILSLAGAIVAISAAAGAIVKLVERVRKPNHDQDKRIEDHERRLKEHDGRFDQINEFLKNDKKRLDCIEEGNKVTQQALLALLAHALDGNNSAQLQKAKDSLQQYLIDR